MTGRARFLASAAIVAVAFLAYAPALQGGLVMDDRALLADAGSVERVSDLLGRGVFSGVRDYGGYYRPLTTLSFVVEARLGWDGPAQRHATNVLLHAAVAVAAFLLLAAVLDPAGPAPIPFAGALLFAVHPLGVDAVDPITGRGDLLAVLLLLLSWLALERGGRRGWIGGAVLFGLALLSKESAAVLPGLVAAGVVAASGLTATRPDLRRRAGHLASLLVVLGLYLAARVLVLGAFLEPGLPDPLDNPLAGAGTGARLVGTTAGWLEGARLLVWPVAASPDYSSGALVPASSLTDPSALAGWALALAAVAASLVLARRGGAAFLGIAILLIAWLPAANLLFIAPVLFAGRVLYLPVLGLTLLLAAAGAAASRQHPRGRQVPAVLALLLIIAWTAVTWSRHATYVDDLALWGEAVERTPGNAKAWYNLGNARLRDADAAGAMHAWSAALRLHPDLAVGWSNLGVARAAQGDEAGAAESFRRALEADPALAQAHAGLGSLLLRSGDLAAGRRHLLLSLAWDPGGPDASTIRELLRRLPAD